jgi:membrane associated rhomboid family serine protease
MGEKEIALKSIRASLVFLFGFTSLLWALELGNVATGGWLDRVGSLHPRTAAGLWQIFTSPFLHANFLHLFSNTLGLLMVGSLTLLEGAFFEVSVCSIVVGGLGVWLFAAPHTAELGFSGVLFGMMGFLMTRGLFDRSLRPVLMSLLALFWFGGSMTMGLMPHTGISWAGHFWGFLGGILAARILSGNKARIH